MGDQRVASIQQQLASLKLKEAPVIGAFNPAKGEIVLAQFSLDNSWNRAMVCVQLLTMYDSLWAKVIVEICLSRLYTGTLLKFLFL